MAEDSRAQPPFRPPVPADSGSTAGTAGPGAARADAPPTFATAADVPADEGPFGLPRWVGRYRLGQLLGKGGMGSVYEAEQEHPRRKVALKILRPSMAAETALGRFDQEVQVLAKLQHPGIATIFDAGMQRLELGEPVAYFAMEYIPAARPIDQYAAAAELDLASMLSLFARVCDAVDYAHTCGVVHRDIKPGNVLVDIAGNPKVIDFGIALLKRPDGTQAARYTSEGLAVGTREYMSPEQTGGPTAEIDQRTDVYSLGVLLYQLVTGRMPFDFKDKSDFEVLRMIREVDPISPRAAVPGLPGDVETIILSALAKAPARRYDTAGKFAADVRRYLAGEPIEARKDSPTYVLRKRAESAAGRHPLVWAVIAVALASVVAYYPAVNIVYRWTPLDRWWGQVIGHLVPPAAHNQAPKHTMLVAISSTAEGPKLGEELGLAGVGDRLGPPWRQLHAMLIRRLASLERPPRVIALDFEMPQRTGVEFRRYDTMLAAEIRNAASKGIPVVLAAGRWDWSETAPESVVSDELVASGIRVATATGRQEIDAGRNLVVDLLVATSPADWRRSFALETALAFRRNAKIGNVTADEAGVHVQWLESALPRWAIGSTGKADVRPATETLPIRVSRDSNAVGSDSRGVQGSDVRLLFEAAFPEQPYFTSATVEYADVLRASDMQLEQWFAGKIAMVGDLTGGDAWLRHSDGRKEHGARGILTAVEAIINQSGLRRPTAQESWWIVLATVVAGALLGAVIWRSSGGIVFGLVMLTLVLGTISVWCARSAGYLFNPVVPLLGAFVACAAAAWIRKMRGKVGGVAW